MTEAVANSGLRGTSSVFTVVVVLVVSRTNNHGEVASVAAEVAVAVAPSRNPYYYYSKTTIDAMGPVGRPRSPCRWGA